MSKTITITRKIQVLFDVESKEQLKACFEKVYGWQRIVHRAANHIATHCHIQESVKDFHYFEDGTKKKLANIEKDENGLLTMSKANTTYQVLSKAFKGDAPMSMLSALN